jgi:hypothetical protein
MLNHEIALLKNQLFRQEKRIILKKLLKEKLRLQSIGFSQLFSLLRKTGYKKMQY